MTRLPTVLATLMASVLASATAVSQTFTYSLNPQATYLRINQDSATPPLVLDLAQLGIVPGQWLRIGSNGFFSNQSGGADNPQSLVGVFSSSDTLLATNYQQRVVGAIAAGPEFSSPGTLFGGLPIDVPEDFHASRRYWRNSVDVEVPAGATHLFLGTHDIYYSDNSDPNNDYEAVVTLLATPSLPGTGEHLELASAVGGAPPSLDDVKQAPPGQLMAVELRHPVGYLDGSLYVFVADTITTGATPPQLLPRLWIGTLVIPQFGVIPSTPGWTDTWSLVAPSGLAGVTLVMQAGALSPRARNTLFVTTAAHRFELQ